MPNHLIIRPKPGQPDKGFLTWSHQALPCALGRSGLGINKREGDGLTPRLCCRPLYGFYRSDREILPQSSLPFSPIHRSMGWCDDPNHPSYNRLIKKPFRASHEEMWRKDSLYDLVLVLDINISHRKRGVGSALFMHVARKGLKATEGCIALPKPSLKRLIQHMDRDTIIHIGT